MTSSKNSSGGPNFDTHHLLELREPPSYLVALREELWFHPEIVAYAIEGNSFEECIGRIATKLDLALDGDYDGEKLCALLVDLLKVKRGVFARSYIERRHGLVASELVEREGEVTLEAHIPTVPVGTSEVIVSTDNADNAVADNSEFLKEEHKAEYPDGCLEEQCKTCYPTKRDWDRRFWSYDDFDLPD